jgi:molybdopterin adenylyltransferase
VEHHHRATPDPASVRIAVITVSDTRTMETDEGGRVIAQRIETAGFTVAVRRLIRDEPADVARLVRELAPTTDVLLLTGGTGLAGRDTTVDAVDGLFDKTLPGFGELFRALSFAEIGSAAMLSRATAGLVGACAVFVMPGSPSAVRLAMERLIVPELGHIVRELRRDRPPGGAAHRA